MLIHTKTPALPFDLGCRFLAVAAALAACGAGFAESPPEEEFNPGWEQPGTWERRAQEFYRERSFPTDEIPAGAMTRALAQKRQMKVVMAPTSALLAQQSVTGDRWYSIGPQPIYAGYGRTTSGRVRAIAFDPSDATGQTVYIGAATGGVWKTTNGGQTWAPLSDSADSPAIETIAIDPQDPRIIYAGTGESMLYGRGMLKSVDGGATWTMEGLNPFDQMLATIHRIVPRPETVADPASQRVVIAASSIGLWRSLDGGRTWSMASFGKFTDAAVDPHQPMTMYAAEKAVGIRKSIDGGANWTLLTDLNGELPDSWFKRVNLVVTRNDTTGVGTVYAIMQDTSFGTELKGIWKSADGGAHWTRLVGHPPHFCEGLWVAPQGYEAEFNDDMAHADAVPVGQVFEGSIAATDDVDFFAVTITGNALSAEILADRAHSGLDPVVTLLDGNGNTVGRPSDGSMDVAGRPSRSLDERVGSTGWKILAPGTYYVRVESRNGASAGRYQLSITGHELLCQCDYDMMVAVDPGNPNILYLGTILLARSLDGGVNWEKIYDHGGANWIHADVHTLAFRPGAPQTIYVGCDGGVYRSDDRGMTWQSLNMGLALSQVSYGISQHPTDAGFMLIGMQDNGSAQLDGQLWVQSAGGDGCATAIKDVTTWYVTSQSGEIGKTTDDGAGVFQKVSGLDLAGASWETVLAQDPLHPDTLLTSGGETEGGTVRRRVYRSTDAAETWSKASPDLGERIHRLAIAEPDSRAWFAAVDETLWHTRDNGATWGSSVVPCKGVITDIAISHTNAYQVYVTTSGFGGGHVFRSLDGGETWTDISGAVLFHRVPDAPVNTILIDPKHPNTLFVGGDAGLFRSTDGGVWWDRFDAGLPTAPITDLVMAPGAGPDGVFRAATFGRGVWELRTSNDNCQNAPTIVGNEPVLGTTRGASSDGAASCGSSDGAADVWYRYTADCDGQLRVSACGADFDPVVSIHGSCPGGTGNERTCTAHASYCLSSNCAPESACALMNVTWGQELMIRVAGYQGQSGEFTLTASCEMPNDSCEEALQVSVPARISWGTRGADAAYAPECAGVDVTAPGIWYTVVGTGKTITIDTCSDSTSYDTKLSVYCGGCTYKACVLANDDACGYRSGLTWCSAAGQLYHILVHGYQTAVGQFDLNITEGEPCAAPPDCSLVNDHCSTPVRVSGFGNIGDNTGADLDTAASCATSSRDVWFEYLSGCHGTAVIDTCAYDTGIEDTVLSVYDSCGGHEVACSDDACGNRRSQVEIAYTAGKPVPIRVASYGPSGAQGAFPISVSSYATGAMTLPPGLYVVSGAGSWQDHLVRLDTYDHSSVDVGALGRERIVGLAFSDNLGILYAIQDEGIDTAVTVTVDPQTGTATALGPVGSGGIRGLAYDVDRNLLWATRTSDDWLISINPRTGLGRSVGPLGFGDVQGLAYDAVHGILYGSDVATNQLITIDRATGAGTAVGPFGAATSHVNGLAYDAKELRLYGIANDAASGSASVLVIDTSTGLASHLGDAYAGLDGQGLEAIGGIRPAIAGMTYDDQLPPHGGCPFYRFADFNGLPPGLTADTGGRIYGKTDYVGTFSVSYWLGDNRFDWPGFLGWCPLRVRPPNDDCADTISLSDGPRSFTTVNASTDGPRESALCGGAGDEQVGADVWYCYQSTCTGTLTASLCGSTYDTKLAIYPDCGCGRHQRAIACNDDACGTQSEVSTEVQAGGRYGVRIGGYREARGTGTLRLTCTGVPGGACCDRDGCSIATLAACEGRAGSYQGNGTACAPDSDADQWPDACDGCPADPLKTDPGACGCGVPDMDMNGDGLPDCLAEDIDGDGAPDDSDAYPTDPYRCHDLDADSCDDCALGYANTRQDGADADDDGICAVGDCDDTDRTVWRVPGEVAELVFTDTRTLAWGWPPDPGGSGEGMLFDTLRSEHPDSFMQALCIESNDGSDRTSRDSVDPKPGTRFAYLVRAENVCGSGSLGKRSDGAPRDGRACP